MASSHPPDSSEKPGSEPEFRLTRGWMIVGLIAILIGVGCGLVMSSATFLR